MVSLSIYKYVLPVELVVDFNESLLYDAHIFGGSLKKEVEFEPFYGALYSGTVACNST